VQATPFLLALTACAPVAREDLPDANLLPAGVWEPDPGPGRSSPSVAGDRGTLWFAYTRSRTDELVDDRVWLTQTSADGAVLSAPRQIGQPYSSESGASIGLTDSSIFVAFVRQLEFDVYVRVLDRHGRPFDTDAHRIPVTVDGAETGTWSVRLIAERAGRARVAAALDGSASEVALVGLDPAGVPETITPLGTNDEGYLIGLAASHDESGSAVIAWDRVYEQCFGPHPAEAMTTAVDPTGVADPVQLVRDVPLRGELEPALASSGRVTYVAWRQDDGFRSTIAIANLNDLNAATETGDPTQFNTRPALALESTDRGALAWGSEVSLHVAPFRADGGGVHLGPAHELGVIEPGRSVELAGIVHVAEQRYTVVWSESNGRARQGRVYATTVDLSTDPSPHVVTRASATGAPTTHRRSIASRPCSH
jgi:hypothetical protein